MERRVLIAVVLSFLVLYGYQALFIPPPPAPAATQGGAPASVPAPQSPSPAAPSPVAIEAAPSAAPIAAITTENAERQIVVETATVEATLSNRGGRVLRWRLKEH